MKKRSGPRRCCTHGEGNGEAALGMRSPSLQALKPKLLKQLHFTKTNPQRHPADVCFDVTQLLN